MSCFLPSSVFSPSLAEIKTISLAIRCGQVTEARRSCTDRSRWHGCWTEALEGQDTPCVRSPRLSQETTTSWWLQPTEIYLLTVGEARNLSSREKNISGGSRGEYFLLFPSSWCFLCSLACVPPRPCPASVFTWSSFPWASGLLTVSFKDTLSGPRAHLYPVWSHLFSILTSIPPAKTPFPSKVIFWG